MNTRAKQQWNTKNYATVGSFVPALGDAVLKLLAPQKGEDILDLGCGDGTLTRRIIDSGAIVVGIDSSPAMVEAACAAGVSAHVGDGAELSFVRQFDAVFSNAALHWMTKPHAVAENVARALREGGRFVGEFGGHGNIASIVKTLNVLAKRYEIDKEELNLWYNPTVEEYTKVLSQAGFAMQSAEIIPRPTPVAAGIRAWLQTFRESFFQDRPNVSGEQLLDEAVEILRPDLQDQEGNWTLDYVRLRFVAKLKD